MFRSPRGTADILPGDQPYWRFVEEKIAWICQLYGYQRIDTPVFEDAGLFIRGVGEETDIVQKEMYTFDDRGGNKLTLKPEGTAPVCRAYLEHGMHNLPAPVKLYYFITSYRYERPQSGRYREFHQFGYEAIGEADPALDAEVIDMAWKIYIALGMQQLHLKLNSIGCKACRPHYLAKLKAYFTGFAGELCQDCRNRLEKNTLRLLDCKNPYCQKYAAAAPKSHANLCPDCEQHFNQLKKYLEVLGLPVEIDHCLVRGLDYYTRTVFEIQPEIEGAQSTIGGGGRYDGLIEELGGKPTPALGFATGIERIITNIKRQNLVVPPAGAPLVFVAYLGEEARTAAVKMVSDLRQSGISAILSPAGKSLKAQLRQANTLSVRYTLILGDNEIKTGRIQLRDMRTSEQTDIPLSQLPDLLAGKK